MASVAFHASGYRGDVLPYVPIARQLARRGHDVSFMCPTDFCGMFADEPFKVIGSAVLPSPTVLDQYGEFVARWGTRFGGLMLPRLYFDKIVLPRLAELFEEADTLVSTADVVVSHPWSHLIVGPSAELRGVPTIVGDVFPMLVRSRSMGPPGQRDLGKVLNGASWSLLHAPTINRVWFMGAFRRFRQSLGLPVEGWSLFNARLSPTLNLGMFSAHYQPRLADWPSNYRVSGFCTWTPAEGGLAEDAQEFLDDGEPPVLVTLGSNAAAAHPELFVTVARSLDQHGVRGAFLTSNDQVTSYVRDRVGPPHRVWHFLPLEPLLACCRAVVHAGGLGTIAAVLGAGVPSAIRPAVTDQIWHAQRCEALGIGVRVRRNVATAISRVIHDEDLRSQAADLAAHLTDEDGPATAADQIESHLAA